MGWIPTLPLKLRVDFVITSRAHGERNTMGASKNLLVEGKSYHQI